MKDKEPRRYSFEPNLRPLLEAMHEEAGGTGRLFPNFPRSRDLAEGLRILLAESGVTRSELFVSDETRLNLRFHDLRASTVTWMAVRGDNPALITQRVGHEDWQTLRKYLRTAEAVADDFGDVFPPLPSNLLEPPSFDPVLIRKSLTVRNFSGADGPRTRRTPPSPSPIPAPPPHASA